MNLEGFTIPNPRNDMIMSFRFHVLQHEVQFVNERKMLVNRRIIVLDRYVHHLIVCHHLFSVCVKEILVRGVVILLGHGVCCHPICSFRVVSDRGEA